MNALPPTQTSLLAAERPGYRALWVASAVWVIGSIAGATVAMANVPVGNWSADLPPSAVAKPQCSAGELQRAAETAALTPRFKADCKTCGVVENIRKVNATDTTLAGYEFTVRLRDGSTRVSSDASIAKWRVGDHIMLIGGSKPSSNTPVSL